MIPASWKLRPAASADREFLFRVYASTRDLELAVTGWPENVKSAFLQSQFDAQDRHYRAIYPGASFDVIVVDGHDSGRLYVHRTATALHVIDIALLAEFRGRGIGSMIMRTLLEESAERRIPVSIHVEHTNPARRLYERLGFRRVEDQGVYILMVWQPSPLPPDSQLKTDS